MQSMHAGRTKIDTAKSDAAASKTWNSPEAIAEHRAMSPEQRLRKTIALSQAALRFARAERVDER